MWDLDKGDLQGYTLRVGWFAYLRHAPWSPLLRMGSLGRATVSLASLLLKMSKHHIIQKIKLMINAQQAGPMQVTLDLLTSQLHQNAAGHSGGT